MNEIIVAWALRICRFGSHGRHQAILKSIWFRDIRGPQPYEFVESRATAIRTHRQGRPFLPDFSAESAWPLPEHMHTVLHRRVLGHAIPEELVDFGGPKGFYLREKSSEKVGSFAPRLV